MTQITLHVRSYNVSIKDARVFTGESVIDSGVVVVENGTITHCGREMPTSLPPNLPILSKHGHTLMPGLIDSHVHTFDSTYSLEQSIKFGVTTVMDMDNETQHARTIKAFAQSRNDVADYKSSFYSATINGGWPEFVIRLHAPTNLAGLDQWPKLQTMKDAEEFVNKNIADGADYIKVMQECGISIGIKILHATLDLQAAVVQAAQRRGKVAVAHATCVQDTLLVLQAGVNGTTHTCYDQPITREVIDLYQRNDECCNPTLAAIGSFTGEGKYLQEIYGADERVQKLLTEDVKRRMGSCYHMAAPASKAEYAYENVRKLHKAGVDIVWQVASRTEICSNAEIIILRVADCGKADLTLLRPLQGKSMD